MSHIHVRSGGVRHRLSDVSLSMSAARFARFVAKSRVPFTFLTELHSTVYAYVCVIYHISFVHESPDGH